MFQLGSISFHCPTFHHKAYLHHLINSGVNMDSCRSVIKFTSPTSIAKVWLLPYLSLQMYIITLRITLHLRQLCLIFSLHTIMPHPTLQQLRTTSSCSALANLSCHQYSTYLGHQRQDRSRVSMSSFFHRNTRPETHQTYDKFDDVSASG